MYKERFLLGSRILWSKSRKTLQYLITRCIGKIVKEKLKERDNLEEVSLNIVKKNYSSNGL